MTLPRRAPSSPCAPLLPWPVSTRPSGGSPAPAGCGRRGSRSRRARAGPSPQLDFDRDVADQARTVLAHRCRSRRPTPGILVAERVRVAEELVAAADAEDHRPARGSGVQRVTLGLDEIVRAQRLVAILAAAEIEEVVGVGVELVARARVGELEADPAPRAAALRAAAGCRGRRRCSSGRGTARRRAASRSDTSITTVEPT